MRNLNLIAEELFNKIRGRFPSVTIGDSNGKVTNKPDLARFYDFDYTEGDAKLGRVSVTIDEESVEVMYSNDFVANEDTITRNNWYSFLKELRAFSKKRLLKFDTRNINKSNLDQRDYKFLATNRTGDGTMTESKMYGTSKTSYQNVGEARIAIKHNKPVNTESASGRIQNISAIYIESADGERFKYPFKHVNGARAMARHVSEGGKPFDEFGTHVASLSEELVNLKRFKSYVNRSSVMAEGLSGYKLAVNERVEELKKTITSLQKENFYKTTFENFVKPIFEDIPEDVAENWIDQLTIRQFNEELKDVFPFVYRLVSEATKATVVTASDLLGESDIDDELSEEQPAETYVVKSGDTIWSIADRFSNSNYMGDTKAGAKDILELNGITNPRSLQPGQKLEIGYFLGTGPSGGSRGLPPGGFKNYESQIEDSFEDMMGQFAEAKEETKVCKDCGDEMHKPTTDCKHDCDDENGSHWVDANNNGIGDLDEREDDDDTMDVKIDKNGNLSKDNGQDGKEQKIPVSEFILSMFDRESGQFPKGETAVLTAIEKDYGEQYINPGKAFIEAITAKFEELNVPQEPMIDEIEEPTKQKGTGSHGVYKILDQKTGKVQGPKGIEYFPVSADGNVIWNRKALPNEIPGTIGSREIAIRNLQLQGFKIGGDHMKGDSEYSKDTKGNWVTRKQAGDDDWKVNTVAPADKANAANDAYYKKRNRDIAKRMGFDSPRAAKDAFNKMSTSKKSELQKIYNQEIDDYQMVDEIEEPTTGTVMEPTIQQDEELGDIRRLSGI